MTKVWMPLYWGDYLRDTSHLSAAEHGAYLLLIGHYWVTGQPLPADHKILARIARMTPDEFDNACGMLRAFFSVEGDKWRHARIEKELSEWSDKKNKQKQRAKAAADARWNAPSNASSNAPSMRQAMLEQCPSPSPSPSPSESSSTSKSYEEDSRQRDKKKSTTENAKPDPEIAQAVEMYNDLARECGLPVAQRITDTRRRSLKKRLTEAGGIDGWAYAMAQIRASDYLRGKVNGWRADLDFVLQAKSFTKIMEGAYANGPKRQTSSGNGFIDLARMEGDLPSLQDNFEGFSDD